MVNFDAGFVLTMIFRVSPARRLVWEQYPSILGLRYRVLGSIQTFFKSQSVVPGLRFSSRISSRCAGAAANVRGNGSSHDARPAATVPPSSRRRETERSSGVGAMVVASPVQAGPPRLK